MTILLLAYYVQPLLFFLGKIHFYQYLFAVSVLFCFVLFCFILSCFVCLLLMMLLLLFLMMMMMIFGSIFAF